MDSNSVTSLCFCALSLAFYKVNYRLYTDMEKLVFVVLLIVTRCLFPPFQFAQYWQFTLSASSFFQTYLMIKNASYETKQKVNGVTALCNLINLWTMYYSDLYHPNTQRSRSLTSQLLLYLLFGSLIHPYLSTHHSYISHYHQHSM